MRQERLLSKVATLAQPQAKMERPGRDQKKTVRFQGAPAVPAHQLFDFRQHQLLDMQTNELLDAFSPQTSSYPAEAPDIIKQRKTVSIVPCPDS